MKDLVEQELATLRVGTTIARMRERHHLTQTQLAARAGMSASKISAIEAGPKNVELATLIRIAAALGHQFKPKFVPAELKSARSQSPSSVVVAWRRRYILFDPLSQLSHSVYASVRQAYGRMAHTTPPQSVHQEARVSRSLRHVRRVSRLTGKPSLAKCSAASVGSKSA